MRFEQMTIKLQDALQSAQKLCEDKNIQAIESEALILALLEDAEGVGAALIKNIGVEPGVLKNKLLEKIGKYPTVSGVSGQSYISATLKEVLDQAFDESKKMKDEFLSGEHIFLAFAQHKKCNADFKALGITYPSLLKALQSIRGSQRITDQNPESKYQALDKFCIDLTERARSGKLDPVIGRDSEIRRTIQVLSRRTKNNPVLIGEPGVGKTAIVEGLAQRINHKDVPEGLKDKRILMLDLAQMVAGTKYRGEFEDRLKAVLKGIKTRMDKSFFSLMSYTLWWEQVLLKAQWMPPICSNPRWPGVN